MPAQLFRELGVDFPVVAFSHCRDVVAAVSRTGGIGVLGAVGYSPDRLETALRWIDTQVGDRPYGVDLLIPASYVGADNGGHSKRQLHEMIPQRHRDFVDELLDRHGVPPLPDTAPHRREGFDISHRAGERLLEVILAHPQVRLIANALGPPPGTLVEAAHHHGALVAGLAGTPAQARRHVDAGADLVVAQGYEAGGHTGEISTMVLVPQVVDAVAPTPVLAAGGIADGRQLAAALALGAEGVWCGSVWLTTREAETHPAVREKMLTATSSDTVRSRASTGKPARQLRTAWTEAWDDHTTPPPLPMPLHGHLTAEAQSRLRRYADTDPGARELITYFVGQVVGQLDQVSSTKDVLLTMIEEFADTLERMGKLSFADSDDGDTTSSQVRARSV